MIRVFEGLGFSGVVLGDEEIMIRVFEGFRDYGF